MSIDRTEIDYGDAPGNPLDKLLVPSGGLMGPLFASLLRRLRSTPTELPRGELIGPYRIISTLGRGGMATVYLAERADGEFEQRVALKLITPGRDAPAARELLRRERQIMASLQHPHIARLLDGGTSEDGLLWFAMEPITGERIDQYCARHGLTRRQRLPLFEQVCAALRFAHARLLIHRDIKPSNILVTDDGEVKLLDFGIAAVLQSTGELATAPQAMTPAYASPEQRRGEPATVASDIWQLGRLLEVMMEVAPTSSEPKAIDADLAAIIARSRHEHPGQRYESASELAADVRRYQSSLPVVARKAGPGYRLRLFVIRHAWASAIAGLALSSGVAMGAHFTLELKQERDAAAREAERANAATSFLINQFGDADPGINRGSSMTAEQILARATERLNTELKDKPALRASLLLAIAKIHIALGEPTRARPLVEEALTEIDKAIPPDRFARAQALQIRGVIALQLGHQQRAMAAFAASAALNDTDSPAAQDLRLQTLDVHSMALMGAGRLDAALATQREAVALASRLHGAESRQLATSLHNLAIVLRTRGEKAQTAEAFGRAWTLLRLRLGNNHPQTAAAQSNYALALLDQGELDQAQPLIEEAVLLLRQIYRGRGQHYAGSIRALARLHQARGEWRDVVRRLEESEALYIEALGPKSMALTYTLHALADAHAKLGDSAMALAYFQRSLSIRRELLAPGHPMLVGSTSVVARELLALGRFAEAQAVAEKAVALARKLPRVDHHLPQALQLLGEAHYRQGRVAEAQKIWNECGPSCANQTPRRP